MMTEVQWLPGKRERSRGEIWRPEKGGRGDYKRAWGSSLGVMDMFIISTAVLVS